MSQPRRYPRKAEITRAVAAAKAAGIDVSGLKLAPDGTITLLPASAVKSSADAFDIWADRL